MRKVASCQRERVNESIEELQKLAQAKNLTRADLAEVALLVSDACDGLAKQYELETPSTLRVSDFVNEMQAEYVAKAEKCVSQNPINKLLISARGDAARNVMHQIALECISEMDRILQKVSEYDLMEAKQQEKQDNAPIKRVIFGRENVDAFIEELNEFVPVILHVSEEKVEQLFEDYPEQKEVLDRLTVESYYAMAAGVINKLCEELDADKTRTMLFFQNVEGRSETMLSEAYDAWVEKHPEYKERAEASMDELQSVVRNAVMGSWKTACEEMQERDSGRGV